MMLFRAMLLPFALSFLVAGPVTAQPKVIDWGDLDYMSLFVDINKRSVLFATEGHGAETIAKFADDLEAHNGHASNIKQVCIDMRATFIKGVTDNLSEAEITE